MAETGEIAPSAGGYVVLREVAPGQWQLIGDVDRRPGLPARRARVQAVSDAGGSVEDGSAYAAVPRSEWRVARQL